MKRASIITVIVMGLLTFFMSSCSKQEEQSTKKSYPTMTVSRSEVTLLQRYTAAIQGKQDIAILPQVSGFLTELCVKEGQHVQRGQKLFQIDEVNYMASVRVAEANKQSAEALVATNQLTFDSKKELYNQGIISEYELKVSENALLTAKAQLAQAEATVVNARQNLSYTVVKSPCNGIIGRLPFREGTLVSPQMSEPLTTVSDNSEMFVYFSMTEVQVMELVSVFGSVEKAIKEMPDVTIELGNGAVYPAHGRIESISGVIDHQTGSVSIRAVFPNPDRILFSGGSCNLIMPVERHNVIVIPQAATYDIQNKTYVYVVEDGKATSRIVRVNPLNNGKEYIVEEGLQGNETIISEGAGLVREGTVVE